jgi:hypothetical protein|tara:strand:+ start:182 stop:904 length:723 start_codon:yes stop_codon:yes gene_type:complete
MKLLNIDKNPKTVKGRKKGYATAILYLSPADTSGKEVCSHRTAGCTEVCLNTAGRGATPVVQNARKTKTHDYHADPLVFVETLEHEIRNFEKWCKKKDLLPCVRLNGTSDIPWEKYCRWLMDVFPSVQFYDYTKNDVRMNKFLEGKLPSNYHLTFSATEDPINRMKCREFLKRGGTAAVVFREQLPILYFCDRGTGSRVIDGDVDDLRFLDPKSVVVGLKAKGKARHDTTGFVVAITNFS